MLRHAVRLAWGTLLGGGLVVTRILRPDLVFEPIALILGGWCASKIVEESLRSLNAILEHLGESEEQ